MTVPDRALLARGPFTADMIPEGAPYELTNGHPIYCAPAGGRHGTTNTTGASLLGSDPNVQEAGVDTGFSPDPGTLRAPDVAVGNVPNEPGWVKGAPELAVEYADKGQDEEDLRGKIRELLCAGTKFFWVVRLTGPRRVEIHERGKAMRLAYPGELLTAPGVLKNPVLVEALYDREAAHRATLTNLLQREGYQDLEAVRADGEAKGLRVAVRAIVDLCEVLGIPIADERKADLVGMNGEQLDALRERIKRDRRWD